MRVKSVADIRPYGDRVVIREDKAGDRRPSGLYVPDAAKEKPTRGVVLSVGPGRVLDDGRIESPECKPGDRVVYGKWSGIAIEAEDEGKVLLCPAAQVLVVLGPGDDDGEAVVAAA